MSEEVKKRMSLTKHLRQANHCNLSQKAIEWINGELLGDGCLFSESPYSAKFLYTSKYLEYIQYVVDTLKSFGIEQVGKINKCCDKRLGSYTYQYASRAYPELLLIRKQWYPEGKKIVPKDLKLTSLTCRQWYIGDGCLEHPISGKPHIRMGTYGFLIEDVKWLARQLINLGIKATRLPNNNTINISVYSTKDFIKYIENCPISCYQYKWAY
jgi:hypothetical protein